MRTQLELENVYDKEIVAVYADIRPVYPSAWANVVLEACGGSESCGKKTIVDVATGTGQVTATIGHYFNRIIAIDYNESMMNQATHADSSSHQNSQLQSKTTFISGQGEFMADLFREEAIVGDIDVVVAGQCLHWMDLDAFWKSLGQVLTRQGVFIASFYGPNMQLIGADSKGPSSECLVDTTKYAEGLWNTVGAALPNSSTFFEHFNSYKFPFNHVRRESIPWRRKLTFDGIARFIRTGAALRCYNDLHSENPFEVDTFIAELKLRLGDFDPSSLIEVEWNMTIVICRNFLGDETIFRPLMNQAYNHNSLPQNDVIAHSFSILSPLLAHADILQDQQRFLLADYGCAGGQNSLSFAGLLLEKLRSVRPSVNEQTIALTAILTDLPGNDFNAVFNAYNASRLKSDSSFYLSAASGNLYETFLPAESVDFACSFSALHWLSSPPPTIRFQDKNVCYISGASMEDAEAVATLSQYARDDLEAFLLSRAKELKADGLLIFSCLGVADCRPDISPGGHRVCRSLGLCLRQYLVDTNRSDTEGLLLPIVPRNKKEIYDSISNNPDLNGMFDILHAEVDALADSFLLKMLDDDAPTTDLASKRCGFIRSWSESSLRQVLPSDDDINQFYDRVSDEILHHSDNWIFDNTCLIVCLRKRI
jgi:SAM-dependent methyltransferase